MQSDEEYDEAAIQDAHDPQYGDESSDSEPEPDVLTYGLATLDPVVDDGEEEEEKEEAPAAPVTKCTQHEVAAQGKRCKIHWKSIAGCRPEVRTTC